MNRLSAGISGTAASAGIVGRRGKTDLLMPVVTPSSATLVPSATQQFAANMAVTWSVVGGAANGSSTVGGLYSAPATIGSYIVQATSTANPSKVRDVSVTVATAMSSFFTVGTSTIGGSHTIA